MRILFAMPHYFREESDQAHNRSRQPRARAERRRSLVAAIAALHQAFGNRIYGLDHQGAAAWQAAPSVRHDIDIVVCTAGEDHLLGELPWLTPFYRQHAAAVEPAMLGFECHRLLGEAIGHYDYYGYIEDDIAVIDPLFFRKRRLFDRQFGPEALLQPNRCEVRPDGPVQKLYVDYHLRPELTAPHQDVTDRPRLQMPFIDETIQLERTSYPSAGCFFLSDAQVRMWTEGPHFRDGDVSYMGPLDSAATLSVMKTFRIYKPVLDQAWFLEVLHLSPRWINGGEVRLMPRDEPFSPIPRRTVCRDRR
ncbi:hypothetical protein [Telmatospirillum siberiense]|uniref:Calcium-binding protein n=1 Tax=Telmatospirillum siberiense TaxID=382514 RepID=A0A2N3PPR9_9PROT|nr:hypothetical protein [Telmatospirillum siberiense]PKU22384.1 hypothetical protein CWS72_22175 [Telmatospirillum siberiense]